MNTPFYQYDLGLLRQTLDSLLEAAINHETYIHYAIKANNQPRILNKTSAYGFGADCVSIHEVRHALEHGFSAESIVFSGTGKRHHELRDAVLLGIGCLNVEGLQELELVGRITSELTIPVNISLRITPDTEVDTHEYLTTGRSFNKFGLLEEELPTALELLRTMPFVHLIGLHVHAGSQILDLSVFTNLAHAMNRYNRQCVEAGYVVRMLNLGGGLGISYDNPDEQPIADFDGWFSAIRAGLEPLPGQEVHVEPGRSVVAQCGSLITSVLYTKARGGKTFAILDAGMTDLMRPALYGSRHLVQAINPNHSAETEVYDLVGPICESSDVFATALTLPCLAPGSLLTIRSAGAYGQTMSNRYNMRQEAAAEFIDVPFTINTFSTSIAEQVVI
jgi:diaminopimelate decarboxylase